MVREIAKERNILIGLVGLLAVFVFLLSWYTAAMSDPAWIFGTNYLSDLGVSANETACLFFNGGCIIGGALLALFGVLIIISNKELAGQLAGPLALLAGVSMALVGVFPEDAGDIHVILALMAFGIGFLCLIAISVKDWKNGLRTLALITPVAAILAITFCLLVIGTDSGPYTFEPLFGGTSFVGTPGVETVVAVLLFSLLALQGMKFMYRGGTARTSPDGSGVSDRHKLAFGFAALLAMASFLVFWLFASLADPSWIFGTDQVYLLGLSSVAEAQMCFSIACIAGGFFTLVYGIGSSMMRSRPYRGHAGFFITLAGGSLMLMGIALIQTGGMWEHAEYVLLILGSLGLACVIASDWSSKRMVTAALYLVLLIVVAAGILAYGSSLSSFCVLALFSALGIEGVRLLIAA
ncbi:MAG: DUF998 domain-containing protein [Methanomassiliicoccaceae archaeon]|jgi:hypothetical membrane protein|nr:DUF998 domain-containing protein [Methanomassiliicoccaceae archaeon]